MAYNPATLGPAALALYAELLSELVTTDRLERDLRSPGTLVSKRVKGKRYWYVQYVEVGHKQQVYLGPESPELLERLEAIKERWEVARDDAARRARLVSMLQVAGVRVPDTTAARVLEVLANHALFRVGGVLVGSHAFACYGAMLGVSWAHGWQTADVDVARERAPSLAVAVRVDLPAVLDASEFDFRPIPGLDPREPATSYSLRGRELTLDILTPETGKPSKGPVWLPSLKMAAHPLRFLDYLIEEPIPAAVVARTGLLVQVPDPARFALHKLLVSQRRPVFQEAKAVKDRDQASQLLQVLLGNRPGDVVRAWEALESREDKGLKLVRAGVTALDDDLRARLAAVVPGG